MLEGTFKIDRAINTAEKMIEYRIGDRLTLEMFLVELREIRDTDAAAAPTSIRAMIDGETPPPSSFDVDLADAYRRGYTDGENART